MPVTGGSIIAVHRRMAANGICMYRERREVCRLLINEERERA